MLAGLALGLLFAAAAWAAGSYSRDRDAARQRVSGRSMVIPSRFGTMEYAVAGEGAPLLMIHGTGGGFDQGLTFAEKIIGRGHKVIAPSRFGYLRSDYPDNPSSANQADAFADLLDRLGVDKIAVAGGSAGALSAVEFALRHPDRTSALILIVPAANVRGRDPVGMSPALEFMVRRLLTSELLYWTALKLAPDQLIRTLLATDPALVAQAAPEERRRVERILEEIKPIGSRWRGMLNDAELAGNPAQVDFSRIGVPTLVISAEDDGFGTAATARDIAVAVPGAKLVMFKEGGHVFVGHDAEAAEAVSDFVRAAEAS